VEARSHISTATEEENRADAARRRATVGKWANALFDKLFVAPVDKIEDVIMGEDGKYSDLFTEDRRRKLLNMPFNPTANILGTLKPESAGTLVREGTSPMNLIGGGLVKAGITFPKTLRAFLANIDNYVGGFYAKGDAVGAQKLMTAANNLHKGGWKTVQQYLSPLHSARYREGGLPLAATEVLEKAINKLDELRDISKSRKLTADELSESKHMGKLIVGQLGYDSLIAKQGRALTPWLDEWKNIHYHDVVPFNKESFRSVADIPKTTTSQKDMDIAFDVISNTWKQGGKGLGQDGKDVYMAIKKARGPRSIGMHDNDLWTSSKGKELRDLLIANGKPYKTIDELDNQLLERGFKVVNRSDDGVWIQTSPERGSGYVEGGTNALVKIKKDRNLVLFTSDEHDLFGMVPPGHDRMVTILPPWTMNLFTPVTKRKGVGASSRKVVDTKPQYTSKEAIEKAKKRLEKDDYEIKPSSGGGGGNMTSVLTKAQEFEARKLLGQQPESLKMGHFLRTRGGAGLLAGQQMENL